VIGGPGRELADHDDGDEIRSVERLVDVFCFGE